MLARRGPSGMRTGGLVSFVTAGAGEAQKVKASQLTLRIVAAAVVSVVVFASGNQLSASAQTSPDLALEQRLADLKFDPGPVDGAFDEDTSHALIAFQKVHGMERSGEATPESRQAITASTTPPAALVPGGGPNRVEIDLGRQVLLLYENGQLLKVLPVSTGSGEEFCSEGWCRNAITAEGSFEIYRQVPGWDEGPLGSLYNAQYFNGGIAIHGSMSVPAEPASHGCVRIPMSAAEWFPDHVSVGTPVFVLAGGVVEPVSRPVAAPNQPVAAPTSGAAPAAPHGRVAGSPLAALLAALQGRG